jgi:acetylornithine aminotransferase
VDGGVLANGRAMGEYFRSVLEELQSRHACIQDVRGRGLLLGVQLENDGAPVVNACLEKGFLVNCIQERVLRLAPPLVVAKEQIDALVACLDQVLP